MVGMRLACLLHDAATKLVKVTWALGPNIDPCDLNCDWDKLCVVVKSAYLAFFFCLTSSATALACVVRGPVQMGWGKSVGAGGIPH